jgi:adenylyltransferase/sulfurtransferase
MTVQMQPGAVRIAPADLEEDRFARFGLIQWWDQAKIAAAKVLVVGAGALGNEILKNLALLGFRKILVVDLDRIEHSNLSRSVLYRASDVGRSKAETAARATVGIYSEITAHAIDANILHDVGLGVFDWADLIFAGLDNREARLWINRSAWKLNRPWIDGAIEGVNGVARVFLPGQEPCYECTLGEVDWEILEKRLSCNLLTREEMEMGRTPTTPTISSIIGGIQVQEAVKLLHGQPVLAGKGYVFEGLHHTSYVVEYTVNPDCMSHHTYERLVRLEGGAADFTLGSLLAKGRDELGSDAAAVEFSRDVIRELVCPQCGAKEEVFAPVGSISAEQGRCPADGTMREVVTMHGYDGADSDAGRRCDQIGLPLFDVMTVRTMDAEIAYLFAGDGPGVLGPLTA